MYLGTESSMTEAKLTIGHIAKAAGVHIETVRYYQRRGLVSLPPNVREDFGITRRRPRVGCVSIKRAQALGCPQRSAAAINARCQRGLHRKPLARGR